MKGYAYSSRKEIEVVVRLSFDGTKRWVRKKYGPGNREQRVHERVRRAVVRLLNAHPYGWWADHPYVVEVVEDDDILGMYHFTVRKTEPGVTVKIRVEIDTHGAELADEQATLAMVRHILYNAGDRVLQGHKAGRYKPVNGNAVGTFEVVRDG